MGDVLERERVTVDSEAGDHSGRCGGQDGFRAPLGLAAVYVGDVNLDDRALAHLHRIQHRYRVVAEGRRIDDDPGILARLLKPVDHLVFRIGLPAQEFQSVALGHRLTEPLDVAQRLMPIEMRLPDTEKIEIRAVQYVDARRCHYLFPLERAGAVRQGQYMLMALINLLVR